MPLSVSVGLSRKRSENFQSEGASINISADIDPILLARPVELQLQINSLYEQAEVALELRLAAMKSAAAKPFQPSIG